MRFILIFSTFFFVGVLGTFRLKEKLLKLHGFGNPCSTSDESCCKHKFTSLFPLLVEGIGHPVAIPKLKIGNGKGVLQLDQTLENIKIDGLNKATVTDSKLDLGGGKLMLVLHAKELKINKKYNINGKCLALPIWGKGDGHIVLKNVDIKLEMMIGLDNGKLRLDDLKLHILKLGGANLKMSSLFGEGKKKTLTQEFEKVLNDNAHLLVHDLLPDITPQLEKHFLTKLKPIMSEIPLEMLLLLPVLSK